MPNLHKVYGSCEMTQAGVLQFAIGYQWTNGLLYIDNAECIWNLFGVIPIVSLLSEEEIAQPEPESIPKPEVEPDTGEFRYGQQECHYADANGEQNFCVVEGWTKPASELDCEKICAPPGTKK